MPIAVDPAFAGALFVAGCPWFALVGGPQRPLECASPLQSPPAYLSEAEVPRLGYSVNDFELSNNWILVRTMYRCSLNWLNR